VNIMQGWFCMFGGHIFGDIVWDRDATWYKCRFCGKKRYLYKAPPSPQPGRTTSEERADG
jgi:hypothetical protein